MVKNQPDNARDAGDTGSVPGLGRSPGGGNSSPLQYSHRENPLYRRAWWAAVLGATEQDITEHMRNGGVSFLFKNCMDSHCITDNSEIIFII